MQTVNIGGLEFLKDSQTIAFNKQPIEELEAINKEKIHK